MTGKPPQYEPSYNYGSGRYILKYRKPVLCDDLMKWGMWYERANRCVRSSWFNGIRVSTVFLSFNYDFIGNNKRPLLFETVVFYYDSEIEDKMFARCSTWREALYSHKAAKNEVIKKGIL